MLEPRRPRARVRASRPGTEAHASKDASLPAKAGPKKVKRALERVGRARSDARVLVVAAHDPGVLLQTI